MSADGNTEVAEIYGDREMLWRMCFALNNNI